MFTCIQNKQISCNAYHWTAHIPESLHHRSVCRLNSCVSTGENLVCQTWNTTARTCNHHRQDNPQLLYNHGFPSLLDTYRGQDRNLKELTEGHHQEWSLRLNLTQAGGAVANRLRRRTSDQTVLGSNPAVAAALSPWTRLFTPSVPRRSLHISFYWLSGHPCKIYTGKKKKKKKDDKTGIGRLRKFITQTHKNRTSLTMKPHTHKYPPNIVLVRFSEI